MKNNILEAIWFPINADNLHLRSEQIRLRLRNYLSMIGGQAVLLVIFDWIMWGVLPHATLLMYDALWALAAFVELVWWWRNRERINTVQECNRWHIAFIAFTGFFALFWGGMAIWLFPDDLIHQVLLLMLLLGLAGASVSTNTVYPLSFYVWIVGVMVPPILHFASVGDEAHWAIAGFATLYLAVLIKGGGEVGDAFLDALRLRFDKERVIQELLVQQSIANQARSDAELLARTDHLTGLNNRRAFYEIAGPVWSTELRSNRDVSVILLDIDHFKALNDNYGHAFGDEVLGLVASVLKVSAREGDVVARWGGEEFILFLPETNLTAAMVLAERLRVSISEMRIDYGQTPLSVTASFGVVQRAEVCLTVDELTSRADKCLYQAKSDGRNRVCDRFTATPNEA
jgi:diguanylate cyclase (GGDEF)-like protein